jgi:hypothetical protein
MPGTTSERHVTTARTHHRFFLPKTWLRSLLLAWVMGCLALGCTPVIQHQANERLVDQLGEHKGRERLKDVLVRSISPQVVEVDITDDFFLYRFRQAVMGIPTGAVLENKVFFANAARVDVFENNVANVYTSASHLLAQFVFGSGEDARTFADLVASFRARHARKS